MDRVDVHYRACLALVTLFRAQAKANLKNVHSRVFNYILHPEQHYVHVGQSVNVKADVATHPEHVVPCAVLVKECFRLIESGMSTDDEIAAMLQRHWKIVTITKTEAKRLDQEFKLKSKMPDDWSFETGDTFARLENAGIVLLSKN